MICKHVYKDLGLDSCPKCGKNAHEIDWKKENQLREQWLNDNPDAGYGGWMSI